MTNICIGKIIIIDSDNGLAPRRQAIIRTNDGILLIGTLDINFSGILIEIIFTENIFTEQNALESVGPFASASIY